VCSGVCACCEWRVRYNCTSTTVLVQLYWYNCTGTTVLLFVVLKTRDKMLKNGENTLSSWFVSLNQLNQQGS